MSSSVGRRRATGGVQSVARAFELLEVMADAGGVVGLSHLASVSGLPAPTIHRLIRTLVDLGYVRQELSREYSLGPRLIPLGENASRLVSVWVQPQLTRLVEVLGESANLAVLNGAQIVYIAQEPGRHAMRMFTEVGRRVSPHCTAVGKALLALMPPQRIHDILERTEMVAHTPNTITDPEAYLRELEKIRARLRDRRGRAGTRRALRRRRLHQRACSWGDLHLRPDHPDDRSARTAGGTRAAGRGRRLRHGTHPARRAGHGMTPGDCASSHGSGTPSAGVRPWSAPLGSGTCGGGRESKPA